ncbi:MAG: helix-turn-helix transcriptional regulator [Butyrivibrio sp.]|uniref:helix-turn-helix domain-containing protein n=1 Tax=Butyrivibrio sp. TaxID=28121 RepID=UPI001B149D6F|nr:helix-turn-helix transcriptional regulator [Butyrivibrio sp.]MBO6239492.1 helix-turn-helix transcriptional regulator [Butyrivibrio sp.]MBP3239097.1 helix-turn-helix transcriptional regulator [Oribacterium sp.]
MNNNQLPRLIKLYRGLRNMSQKDLSDASGIPVNNLKKYENEYRNPKIEQIQIIAKALNVSLNAFTENSVTDVGDIMAYIIALDEQTDFTINCEKDDDGNYLPETMSFSFNDVNINKRIADYLKYKESNDNATDQDEKYQFYLNNIDNNIDN